MELVFSTKTELVQKFQEDLLILPPMMNKNFYKQLDLLDLLL